MGTIPRSGVPMPVPRTRSLIGIALVSMAVLNLEIALTRIFSVMMWYHFAFMAISLALLGSGAAGVWLYLGRRLFPPERTARRLTLLATAFAVAAVGSFALYTQLPFDAQVMDQGIGWEAVGWLALIYLLLAVPFFFGGATIALAISRFGPSVGRVYFLDLVGASAGCVLSIAALGVLGGAGSVLLSGALGAVAAALFAWGGERTAWRLGTLILPLLLIGLLAGNLQGEWLQVAHRTGFEAEHELLWERWNALSRVSIYEDPWWLQPFGWGLSPNYQGPDPGHLLLLIDSKAGTPIQRWAPGDWATIDFLRYDLTSLAYHLLSEPEVFIIGPGGGRDMLTGLLFGARRITGVELNPAIIDAVRGPFAEYAGQVYDQPNVQVEVEDARTYLARQDRRYDLIQASLIDTWAASSAGAFALSENGLYTREAFLSYYERLSEGGIVSFSRWYFPQDPAETLRMVALGLDAWQRAGVEDPAAHIVVIANLSQNRSATEGLATMLLKRSPFTTAEVDGLAAISREMAFTILYAPGLPVEPNPVQALVTAPDLARAIAAYRLDISPPTDDRPFFFSFVRAGSRPSPDYMQSHVYRAGVQANRVLAVVLALSSGCTALFVLAPMVLRRTGVQELRSGWSYALYAMALGAGFMLVETPLIQRFAVYLGSPTYALAIVLFTILFSSGIGSATTQRVAAERAPCRLGRVLPVLIGLLLIQLALLPSVLRWTQHWGLVARIALCAGALFPTGLLMGQPFPLGIRWAHSRASQAIPWMWAVNGAASVIGSTTAMVIALRAGFRMVSLAGMLCYGAALLLSSVVWRRAAGVGSLSRRKVPAWLHRVSLARSLRRMVRREGQILGSPSSREADQGTVPSLANAP
jgi:hypothetical protein